MADEVILMEIFAEAALARSDRGEDRWAQYVQPGSRVHADRAA